MQALHIPSRAHLQSRTGGSRGCGSARATGDCALDAPAKSCCKSSLHHQRRLVCRNCNGYIDENCRKRTLSPQVPTSLASKSPCRCPVHSKVPTSTAFRYTPEFEHKPFQRHRCIYLTMRRLGWRDRLSAGPICNHQALSGSGRLLACLEDPRHKSLDICSKEKDSSKRVGKFQGICSI